MRRGAEWCLSMSSVFAVCGQQLQIEYRFSKEFDAMASPCVRQLKLLRLGGRHWPAV